MTPSVILSAATQAGVLLSVRAGTVYAAPAGRLPLALRDEIRTHKAEIVAALAAPPREEVYGAAPVTADLRALICIACRSTDFWQGRGVVACRRCHPPAPGAEVSAPILEPTAGRGRS